MRGVPHCFYLWSERSSDKGAWVQNGGTLLRSGHRLDCTMYKILGLCPNASTHNRVSRGTTHRIVGDRLHIPTFPQLPYVKDFSPAWDKYKHTQALPLKEDFRQFARLGNSRVSRLHEEESSIPQCQLLISKAMQVLKRTEQLSVPVQKSNRISIPFIIRQQYNDQLTIPMMCIAQSSMWTNILQNSPISLQVSSKTSQMWNHSFNH